MVQSKPLVRFVGIAGAVGILAVLVGHSFALIRGTRLGLTRNGYELEVHTEIRSGIRPYAVSQYVYWKTDPWGVRSELWRLTRNELYGKHWVGKTGNLWVLTDSMPGPGGSGTLWVMDPRGKLLGSWGSWDLFQGVPVPVPPKRIHPAADYDVTEAETKHLYRGPGFPTGLIKSTASLTTYKQGGAEELTLPTTTGATVTVDVLWRGYDGKPIAYVSDTLLRKQKPILADVIKDDRLFCPTIAPLAQDSPLMLWTAKSAAPGVHDRHWLSNLGYGWQQSNWLRSAANEREVTHRPDATLVTPARNLLWIEAPSPSNAKTHVEYLAENGSRLAMADLDRHYPANDLHLDDFSVLKDGEWMSIGKSKDRFITYGLTDRVDIYDDHHRRFLFTSDSFDGNHLQTFQGFAGRRPKEDVEPRRRIFSETIHKSPNGIFTLRIREVQAFGEKHGMRWTLLAKVPNGNTTAEVELWTGFGYPDEIPAVYVTNSGRVVMFTLEHVHGMIEDRLKGKTIQKETNLAVMTVTDTGGDQLAGIDLLQPFGFQTLDQVRAGVLMRKLGVESRGQTIHVVDGLKLPCAEDESFTLRIANRKSQVYHVSKNPFNDSNCLVMLNH